MHYHLFIICSLNKTVFFLVLLRPMTNQHDRCDRATSLFPAWVLGAAALGMCRPATLAWFSGSFITAALATTMVFKNGASSRTRCARKTAVLVHWPRTSREGFRAIYHPCAYAPSVCPPVGPFYFFGNATGCPVLRVKALSGSGWCVKALTGLVQGREKQASETEEKDHHPSPDLVCVSPLPCAPPPRTLPGLYGDDAHSRGFQSRRSKTEAGDGWCGRPVHCHGEREIQGRCEQACRHVGMLE